MSTPTAQDHIYKDLVFERAPAVYEEMKLYDPTVHGHPYRGVWIITRRCEVCQNANTKLNLELSTGVWMCSPCIYLPYCKKCSGRMRSVVNWFKMSSFNACPACQPDKFVGPKFEPDGKGTFTLVSCPSEDK